MFTVMFSVRFFMFLPLKINGCSAYKTQIIHHEVMAAGVMYFFHPFSRNYKTASI